MAKTNKCNRIDPKSGRVERLLKKKRRKTGASKEKAPELPPPDQAEPDPIGDAVRRTLFRSKSD